MIATCAILNKLNEYRGVEQLAARRAHNPEVVGSNPSPATIEILKSLDFRIFMLALCQMLGGRVFRIAMRQAKDWSAGTHSEKKSLYPSHRRFRLKPSPFMRSRSRLQPPRQRAKYGQTRHSGAMNADALRKPEDVRHVSMASKSSSRMFPRR